MNEITYEKEKIRAVHFFILLICSIFVFLLVGESILLGWEMPAIILLLVGVAACWFVYITEKGSASVRIWMYFVLSMLCVFFYGTHETSMYDLAPLMLMIIILYAATDKSYFAWYCAVTYYLTMAYEFVFVIGDSIEISDLMVSRTIFHFVLVYVAAYISNAAIKRRKKELQKKETKIRELEEINRRTEDFLTNVSHELRTPINAVTGITAVMLKNEEDKEKRKDIHSVQKAGRRLFEQIEDILDYTEIDTNRIMVSEDSYMVSSIVNDIISQNQYMENENKLELIFDIDPGVPSVLLGDARKIKKIIKHLIDNSFKFTNEGGIFVRVYALRKDYGINLCIRVSDTGVGIEEEEFGKIKERFYQINGGRNRKVGGLGLGLSIVYGLVNAMEGFIKIDSTVGKGTTVSVSIPQKVVDETPSMVLENQKDLCLACFMKPEKYKVPEVRTYYDEVISHLVQGLELSVHRSTTIEELEKLNSIYQLTHLFLSKEEYEENIHYFEELSRNINITVIADDTFALSQGSRIRILRKPFCSLSLISILNSGMSDEKMDTNENHMICPGVRVLVVDDEPMNLMVAEGIFKDYRMEITTAESGMKAITLCEQEDFDLIFLDHMMPEMDGVETLKHIRQIHKDSEQEFTIIAFTANAVSGAREMFLQKGFDEFISKPIEMNELEHLLKKVLPKASILYEQKNKVLNKIITEDTLEIIEKTEENQIEEQLQEKDSTEEKIELLKKMGVNIDNAIQYSQGDEEFYFELLQEFINVYESKVNEIELYFQREDFDNYQIQVHALKSSAKLVGLDTLSEMARCAEGAAARQDIAYIREHQKELLDKYQEVVRQITNVVAADKKVSMQSLVEVSTDEFTKQLEELKECLGTYDMDEAENLISQMCTMKYEGKSVEGLLCDIRQDVEDFEFAAATEKTESLLGSLKRGDRQ